MQLFRRIVQAVSFLLFVTLFFAASYPLISKISVDLFLRLDPLLGISTSLASRSLFVKIIPGLILLILTIVLGRFFCGWICPLGGILDIQDTQIKRREKNSAKYKWIKYSLLSAVIAASAVSVQLVGYLDPISLLTRTFTTVLYPIFVLGLESFLGLLMNIGFLEDPVFSVFDSMKGSILPIQSILFRGTLAVAVIFVSILGLSRLNKRFWCRYLCPLGALLALFSKARIYRRIVSDSCNECGLCSRNCRMEAISENGRNFQSTECINCMDCTKICPQNSVSFKFSKIRQDLPWDYNRRKFVSAGAAGILTAGLLKTGLTKAQDRGKVVRPPGSLEEDTFLDKCVRCGECIRVCSTAGNGLQYSSLESGFEGIWTPIIVPESGYCEYNCNMCGHVCPTGAIHNLPVEERQEMKIGTAHFNKTTCIPWYYGENCMVCEEHCPLSEKAIRFRESDVIRIDGTESTVLLPFVVEDKCIGCGICVNKCPLDGERGIYLTNADEVRWY